MASGKDEDRSDTGLGKGARGGFCLGASLLPLLFDEASIAHGLFFVFPRRQIKYQYLEIRWRRGTRKG